MGLSSSDAPSSDDFISLSVTKRDASRDQGPHPGSRLQREDDDLGEGDDGAYELLQVFPFPLNTWKSLDMADYTQAKERIALGKKSRKEEAKRRKAAISDLIDEA